MKPTTEIDVENRDLLGDRIVASLEIGVCLGLGALATELGKTRDVLRRILSVAGVAQTSGPPGRALYRLRDVLHAVFGERDPERMSAYERQALAKAMLAEDELRVRRGELLDAWDVEQTFAAFSKLVMLKIASAVDVVERDVGISPKQATRLQEHFDEMCDGLYSEIQRDYNKDGTEDAVRGGETGSGENHAEAALGFKSAERIRKKKRIYRRQTQTD